MLGNQPPECLNADFFRWVKSMEDKAMVSFFDSPGLSDSQINRIESDIGDSLPADIRLFYESCDPFGPLRDSYERWRSEAKHVQEALSTDAAVVPINMGSYSSSGSHDFAVLLDHDEYEIVSMKLSGTGRVERICKDMRQYFLNWVEYETASED